jgi:hypothetical protein
MASTYFLKTSHEIKRPPSYGLWYLLMRMRLAYRFNNLIHLFRFVQEGRCVAKHDAIWDSFASIAKDVGFHVLSEQTHVFSTSFL